MKANKIPTPSPEFLQELFDLPSKEIPQADLAELAEVQECLRQARDEFEQLASCIVESLVLGVPVQRGPLAVRLDAAGRLHLFAVEEQPLEDISPF